MTSPLLFVYYANDIDDPDRHRRMIDWLTERGRPDDLTLASRVKNDLDEFPKAVDCDLEALCRGFATGGVLFDGSTLVAFTNAAALGNEAFVASGPNWELRRVNFEVSSVTGDSESASLPPLARRAVFAAALHTSQNGQFTGRALAAPDQVARQRFPGSDDAVQRASRVRKRRRVPCRPRRTAL
ncbi:MAG: hypothetical protein WBC44_21585 [Planctomycetaceae bacterium]